MDEKVLLVEDDDGLQEAVKDILEINNYKVLTANNGKEAIDIVKENTFDVIIMDIMMPVIDGITALKEIRKIGINTPVILVTAKSQIEEKVEGLDAGANDYITKPFASKELLARIRTQIRLKNEKIEKYELGNLTFDKEKSELSTANACLKLNEKECNIMEILVKNQDRIIPKKELSSRIWNEDAKESQIEMYIQFIKDKLIALDANYIIDDNEGINLLKTNEEKR